MAGLPALVDAVARRTARFLSVSLVLLAVACAPLATFDALVPADSGGRLAARDLAYGAHPRQSLDVYRPAAGAEPAPVLIFLYGGSWNSGDKAGYGFVGRAFAARGFVTVIPDYRLVPEIRFPVFLEDLARAVRFARDNAARFGSDPDRIVLVGHSAGAYNALMLALDTRYLAAAGVPPSSVRAVAGLAGPYDFLPFDEGVAADAFASWPRPEETQPITFAGAGAPPAFLATGSDDGTVRPRNTAALAARLRAAGAEVETRTYPGLGHVGIMLALSRPLRGRAPVLDDVAAFLRARTEPAVAAAN